jgi:RimJ/RimL family protein N-acetyltransferase
MSSAVLYRWRVAPGREAEFRSAWVEGTKLIHQRCRSYGARLHQAADGTFWSYARWPSEAARAECFAEHDFFGLPCFVLMQDCIDERLPEVVLDVTDDELAERGPGHPVPTLSTERLVLRAMTLDDAPALHPALSDSDNMRLWSRAPLGSVEHTRDYIRGNIDGEGVQCWVIARADAVDDALGWVVLMDRKPETAELGYILRPDAHGAGIAREAVAAVLEHGFQVRGLRRIFADTDPDNAASIRLLEKVGFRYEGRLRAEWVTHIGVRDSLIYGRVTPRLEPSDLEIP